MNKKNAQLKNMASDMCRNPWKYYIEPFEVCEGVYYVGTSWVACYLIDSKDGLILIDCAFRETLYELFENIRKLGFAPTDIKKLLISHGHFDHCGAASDIKEYSGAEIYFPWEDMEMIRLSPKLMLSPDFFIPFEPDHFYADDAPISLGNVTINTLKTPGHTPGTTSFFFDRCSHGRTYRLGMHGGLGNNTLDVSFLEENGLPLTLRDDYLRSLNDVSGLKVDIVLPSHPTLQGNIMELKDNTEKPIPERFVDSSMWGKMIQQKIELFKAML